MQIIPPAFCEDSSYSTPDWVILAAIVGLIGLFQGHGQSESDEGRSLGGEYLELLDMLPHHYFWSTDVIMLIILMEDPLQVSCTIYIFSQYTFLSIKAYQMTTSVVIERD